MPPEQIQGVHVPIEDDELADTGVTPAIVDEASTAAERLQSRKRLMHHPRSNPTIGTRDHRRR